MSMYGIALLPLTDLVNEEGVLQKWYADDGDVANSIESLRNLLGKLKLHGPAFRYSITKCHLIAKESSLDKAKDLLKDEVVELVGGHCILWSVGPHIGSSEACHVFQSSKLTEYANIVNKLRHVRKSHHRMSIMHLQKVFSTRSPSCQEQHLTRKTHYKTTNLS